MWHVTTRCLSALFIINSWSLATFAQPQDSEDGIVAQSPSQCDVDQNAIAEAAARDLIEQVGQQVSDRSREAASHRSEEATPEEAALTMMQAFRAVQALRDVTVRASLTEQLIGSAAGQTRGQPGLLEQVILQAQTAERPDVIREVLPPALQLVQALPSGYSAAKIRALLTIATLYPQTRDQHTERTEQAIATLDQALQVSGAIRGAEFQTIALTSIANGYIAVERIDRALPLLNQSRQIAETLSHPDPNRKAMALAAIATAYATAGNLEQGLETAQRIQNAPYHRGSALRSVSSRFVQVGHFDRALQIAETIEDIEFRVLALVEIAGGLAQARQLQPAAQIFAAALDHSREANDDSGAETASHRSSNLMSQVVQHYAQAGQLDAARAAAQTIPEAGIRVQTLVAIAHRYREANQSNAATATLTEAMQTVQTLARSDQQVAVWQSILEKTLQLDNPEMALQIAQAMPDGIDRGANRAEFVLRIAREAAAVKEFEVALQAAEAIAVTSDDDRNQAYQAIALSYARAEQFEQAMSVVERVTNDGAYPYQIRTLAAIAGEYAEVRQTAAAEQLLTQALERVQQIASAETRADGLAAIAIQYTQMGRVDRVTALQAEALELTATLSDFSLNSQALREIVGQYLDAGQYIAAIEAAVAMLEPNERTNALSSIINRAIQMGAYEAALQATQALDTPEAQTRFLIALANRYLQTAQPTQATQLLAQAFEVAKTIPGAESKTIVVRVDDAAQGNPIPTLTGDDDNDRGSLLEAIALTYAQARQYNQALQVARSIQNATARSQLLQRLECYR